MQQRPSTNDPFVINLNDHAAVDNGTTGDHLDCNNKTKGRNTLRFRSHSLLMAAVHCIPCVILLCLLILWFFSYSVEKKLKSAADIREIHHVLLSTSLSSDLAVTVPATAPGFLNLTTSK